MIGIARSTLFVMRLIPLWRNVGRELQTMIVYVHPLNYCINLMSSLSAFGFSAVVHDAVFDLKLCEVLPGRSWSKVRTLLYRPLPSGSASTTCTSSFMDLRNCPVPAIVPPVPSHNTYKEGNWNATRGVPAPDTKASMRPSVWRHISGPVPS